MTNNYFFHETYPIITYFQEKEKSFDLHDPLELHMLPTVFLSKTNKNIYIGSFKTSYINNFHQIYSFAQYLNFYVHIDFERSSNKKY